MIAYVATLLIQSSRFHIVLSTTSVNFGFADCSQRSKIGDFGIDDLIARESLKIPAKKGQTWSTMSKSLGVWFYRHFSDTTHHFQIDSIFQTYFRFVIYAGSSAINVVHHSIYGAVLLLYGSICMVVVPSAGLVPGSRSQMGTRSNWKQITFIPFGCMGDTGVANHLCTSAGQSRRYVLTILLAFFLHRNTSLASPLLLKFLVSLTKCLECSSQTIAFLELVVSGLVLWNWTVYSGRRIGSCFFDIPIHSLSCPGIIRNCDFISNTT